MKKLFFFLAFLLLSSAYLSAQADKVLGFWLTEKGTSQVEIYKGTDGKYYGKVSWLDEPNEDGKPKVDDENSDPELQKRPILGLPLLQGFEYDKKDAEWKNGSISCELGQQRRGKDSSTGYRWQLNCSQQEIESQVFLKYLKVRVYADQTDRQPTVAFEAWQPLR